MKTILVIDDEYALVESLTDLLEEEGYRVVSAANGKDGLTRVVKENPDLIITDFMMPIADGLELVRAVRALPTFQAVPVVMMSASDMAGMVTNRRLKLSAFLSKPFQADELMSIVRKLIGKGDSAKAAANK
jgi:CheY-like chemotaxis protein